MTKLEAALNYASLGWHVLPLCWPDENNNCACGWNHSGKAVGKAPRVRNGVYAATTDEQQIRSWWEQWPEANIGVALGPSNLIVLDADGDTAITEVETLGIPDNTPTAKSSRGYHYYFRRPEGVTLVSGARLGQSRHIDIPEYVIVPPSRHHSGVIYEWIVPPSRGIPEAPDWVIALMNRNKPQVVNVTPDQPTMEEAAAASRAVSFLLPSRAVAIYNGRVHTDDRSGQAYELACLAAEVGVTDPWTIACLVYSSAVHRDKFDQRKDGWLDACRLTERALVEHGTQTKTTELVPLSEIPAENVQFLITPYIPRGEITMLEGDPGEGKSWVWMAFVAGLTGSKLCPIPYDATARTDCRAIILTTEDSISKTVRRRLEDLGANLDNIFIFRCPGGDDGQITAADLESVEGHIYATAPDLIIVDPITLYATGDPKFDMDKNTHVRNLLKPLLSISRDLNAACLVVRHFRKGSGKAIYRGLGSIDVTATARSQLSIGKDKVTGQRVVAHAKHNLSIGGPSLYFSLGSGIPPFKWLGIADDITADDLTDDEKEIEKKSALEEAKDFLLELFKDGQPIPSAEGEKQAKELGISHETLKRARKFLRVRSEKRAGDGKWVWYPPGQ